MSALAKTAELIAEQVTRNLPFTNGQITVALYALEWDIILRAFSAEQPAKHVCGAEMVRHEDGTFGCPACAKETADRLYGALHSADPRPSEDCGCVETYPQLIPGQVSHGPGCAERERVWDEAIKPSGLPKKLPILVAAVLEGVSHLNDYTHLVAKWQSDWNKIRAILYGSLAPDPRPERRVAHHTSWDIAWSGGTFVSCVDRRKPTSERRVAQRMPFRWVDSSGHAQTADRRKPTERAVQPQYPQGEVDGKSASANNGLQGLVTGRDQPDEHGQGAGSESRGGTGDSQPSTGRGQAVGGDCKDAPSGGLHGTDASHRQTDHVLTTERAAQQEPKP